MKSAKDQDNKHADEDHVEVPAPKLNRIVYLRPVGGLNNG